MCYNISTRKGGFNMATSSMNKQFILKDEKNALKYIQELKKQTKKRKFKTSPSLEYGIEKLKHFSFRSGT